MNQNYQEDLREIRQVMERSTKFISLSGMAGVMAGLYALAGAAFAFWVLEIHVNAVRYEVTNDSLQLLLADALIVLVLSLLTGLYVSQRKARRLGLKLWDKTAKHLLTHLSVPLVSGGILVLILVFRYEMVGVAAPLTLIFYGLALVSASKFTYPEIRSLGFAELSLGLVSMWFVGYGLFFWALGFGILHVFYGVFMYRKYK